MSQPKYTINYEFLNYLVRENADNITHAAKIIGINRRTIQRWRNCEESKTCPAISAITILKICKAYEQSGVAIEKVPSFLKIVCCDGESDTQ